MTVITGVRPRLPQVPCGGRPAALTRLVLEADPGVQVARGASTRGHTLLPVLDGRVVTFGGAARRDLHAPPHPVWDQGHALDGVGHVEVLGHHRPDPCQGPALVVVSVRGRAEVEQLFRQGQLLIGEAAGRGRTLGAQGITAAGLQRVMPSPGRHAGDAVGTGDVGVGGSGLEVLGSGQAYGLASLAFCGGQPAAGRAPHTSGMAYWVGLSRTVTP